jgi:Low psii accumulation1 / Rep27
MPFPAQPSRSLHPDQLRRLRAEAKAPFRGLRKFFYGAFAGSAFIGAFIFLLKVIAQEDLTQTLPNLFLQLGIGSVMIWLFQKDKPKTPENRDE